MNRSTLITAMIMIIMLASCSKPAEKMDIELLFTIDGGFETQKVEDYDRKFTVISDIEVDSKGNIYLFNPRLERILKFTPDGEFVKYFGSRGTWKGEFMNADDFYMISDTLYIRNNFTPLIIRYTTDGEYIDDFQYKSEAKIRFSEVMKAVTNDRITGYIGTTTQNGDTIRISNKLVIFNKKIEELSVLREYSADLDRNNPEFFEFATKYAHGDGNIYVARNDEEVYAVDIFDTEGVKKGTIEKKYSKVKYNAAELQKLSTLPISVKKYKEEADTLKAGFVYKKSINDLFFDKYGRLLVCPSVKRDEKNQNDFIADVFDGGKFVKRVHIPQLKGEDFIHRFDSEVFFIGDRIYEVLHKDLKVNVYSY
jgi:hypothetical protein